MRYKTVLNTLFIFVLLVALTSCGYSVRYKSGYSVRYKKGILIAPNREYYTLDSSKPTYFNLYKLTGNKFLTEINAGSINPNVLFSPDGSYFAVGVENELEIYESSSIQKINTIRGNFGKVNWFVICPGNSHVAVVNENSRTIEVYGLKDGKPYATIKWLHSVPPHITFNSTGDSLIIGDFGEIQILELQGLTSRVICRWGQDDNEKLANSITISPDGRYIAIGNRDFKIRVIEAYTGKIRQVLCCHNSSIIYLTFSPTGQYLFSSEWDGVINLWDIGNGNRIKSKKLGSDFLTLNNVDFYLDGIVNIYEYSSDSIFQDVWVVKPEYRLLVGDYSKTAREYVTEGVTYYNNNNLIKAEAYFHMAIEKDSGYQPANIWLGYCYAKMSRKTRAIKELQKAILIAPNSVEAENARKWIEKLK